MGGKQLSDNDNRHWYRCHGVLVRSSFELPQILVADGSGAPDIDIQTGPDAARALAEARRQSPDDMGPVWKSARGGVCFSARDVGEFWISDGSTINITPDSAADEPTLALYTMGSALGLALLLRGGLVLHCASLAVGRGATLLLGDSGAGKSTLAQHLSIRGFNALGDDTCALWRLADDDRFSIYPSGTAFKLWRDALDIVGLDPEGLQSVGQRLDKYFVANARSADYQAHAVNRIIVVKNISDQHLKPTLEPLGPLDSLHAVTEHVYRPQFVAALDLWEKQFRQISELVKDATVLRLVRPWGHEFMPQVLDLITAKDGRTKS